MRLYNVRYDDMPRVFAVYCDVNDSAGHMAVYIRNVKVLHQLVIACGHLCAVYRGDNSVSADLLYVSYS